MRPREDCLTDQILESNSQNTDGYIEEIAQEGVNTTQAIGNKKTCRTLGPWDTQHLNINRAFSITEY